METRYASSPKDVVNYTTKQLRQEFMIPEVFSKDKAILVYSQFDRVIAGGIMPVD